MLARRLALAIALIAGLIGSQAPEFAQQYRQRLGGAVGELKRIVAEFDAEAAQEKVTPAEGVDRLERNADPLARQRGEDMAQTIARVGRLEAQLRALDSPDPLTRLTGLAGNFDPQIAQSTLESYQPAAPLSLGALAAAGLAALWGWGATHLCAWPLRRWRRLRAMRGRPEAADPG